MSTPTFLEPVEETTTTWLNPLTIPQTVDLHHEGDRSPTRYRWQPGERKTLSSRYDHAIHRVHNGIIIAGLAPLLVKLGSDEQLDPALDPNAATKKTAEAEQLRAEADMKTAEDAALLAKARAERAADASKRGGESSGSAPTQG
jgi:hypothetical protein